MADILSCITCKAAEYLVDSTLSQLKYLFCFGTNVQNLSNAIEDIQSTRAAVQLRINAARSDEITGPDVLNWLKKVDETNEQVKNTLEAISKVKFVNVKSRYVLSKKATKIYEEILGLCQKGNFGIVVYPAPQVQVPYAASRDFEGFESRMFTRRQVLEALRDISTSVIGICGMAGVGKTVMAKEIADHVKKENVFDKVAMAIVSQNPEPEKEESKKQLIIKIQDQLADELKFSIPEKSSLHARTQSVYTVLQKERDQRVLIILDDLWQDLDLKEIGIPTIDLCKGLKVLLTSRFREVCRNTGAQKVFEVNVLTEEEAWHLFKETARISDDATDLEDIAKKVAQQCGRLPLAIVTVAKALGNKKVESAWFDALEQLKNCSVTNIRGVHDFVYSRIEWSYNYLESEDAKSVLLLCSLFPEDFEIPIEVLVMYVKGLELFQRIETMKRSRDRMDSIILDLKDCYLLLNGKDENLVKMHDVVRDVCLIISSKKQLGYMVSHFGIMEGQQKHGKESYTTVSMTIDQLDQLPSALDHSRLELLRISYEKEKEVLDLPMDILREVYSLKVLHFKKVNIQSSLSLQSLMSICNLFLHNCKLDRNVSFVGLDNLQILSFFKCDLLEFPKGIETLSNLKLLNLMFESCPDPLPKGVLLGLKKLEELYLKDYFERRDGEDAHAHAFDEQHVVEINSLSHLNVLVILNIEGANFQEQVLKRLHLAETTRFYIGSWSSEEIFQFPRKSRRIVEVKHIDGEVLGDPNICKILKKTEDLSLVEAKGLKNVVPGLEKDGFVNLRKLQLRYGADYGVLIDATNLISGNIFHNLEVLNLWGLDNLIEISNGKLPVGSFRRLQTVQLHILPKMEYLWRHSIQPPSLCNLTKLHLSYCHALKYLFPQSILKCFVQLQQISISFCLNLKEIVSKEETSTSVGYEIVELPKLQSLVVTFTNFVSFCNDSAATEGTLEAMINRVSLPSMTSLKVLRAYNSPQYFMGSDMQIGSLHQLRSISLRECKNLKSFFVPLTSTSSQYYHNAQLLPNLEVIYISFCYEMEVLLDFEGILMAIDGEGEQPYSADSKPVVLFDCLQRIGLDYLTGLKQIWKMPKGTTTAAIKAFQNLRYLRVSNCQSLQHLVLNSMAQMLVSLEELIIQSCDMMEEVIAATEDLTITTTTATTIVFPKLRIMQLENLENLRVVFGSSNSSSFNDDLLILPSLNRLELINCPVLTKFCVGPNLSAPKLKQVKVLDCRDECKAIIIPEDLKDKEIIFANKNIWELKRQWIARRS